MWRSFIHRCRGGVGGVVETSFALTDVTQLKFAAQQKIERKMNF